MKIVGLLVSRLATPSLNGRKFPCTVLVYCVHTHTLANQYYLVLGSAATVEKIIKRAVAM